MGAVGLALVSFGFGLRDLHSGSMWVPKLEGHGFRV